MNILKNKWAIIIIVILVLSSTALLFKDKLGPIFGGYEKTKRGYYYRFVSGNKLEKVKGPGYHIVFQYLLFGPDGDTIENKAMTGVELQREYPVEAKNELEDVMQIAAPGSIVEVLVPTDSLIKKSGSSNIKIMALPTGKNAKFQLHILKLMEGNEFAAYQNLRILNRMAQENEAIDKYAAKVKKAWILDTMQSIKYCIENNSKNPKLVNGNTVEFSTEIHSIHGALVVNSDMEGKKYKITIGQGTYQISAFDMILPYLAEGESGVFLVPSDYGYGSAGYTGSVPPYTPLIIKIKDIKLLK